MHEPISWLTLERYHLGELDPSEATALQAKIEVDPTLAARLAQIEAGTSLKPLPVQNAPQPTWTMWKWALPIAAVAAVAVAVLPGKSVVPPGYIGAKGGEPLSLTLVAQRGDQYVPISHQFTPDDVLKVQVTCAPPDQERVQVVVFQEDGASFPYPEPPEVQCGNAVLLPGAFRIDPAEARVCALLSADHVDRARFLSDGVKALPAHAQCITIAPL
ncbi:MAG: hypothetical protein ACE366_06160 [Bradymonadia bacterium]